MDLDDLLEEFEDEKKQQPQKKKEIESDLGWNDEPIGTKSDEWVVAEKKTFQTKPSVVSKPQTSSEDWGVPDVKTADSDWDVQIPK